MKNKSYVMFRNGCDALIMMDMAESGVDSFESNMSDGGVRVL
jgi:hypothetical protein